MAKVLVHLSSSPPRCGACGRILGEVVDGPLSSHTQREKMKEDSVFKPAFCCRSEGCRQRGKFVLLEPVELDEMDPAVTK